MAGDEFLARGQHRSKAALHVRGAPAVQYAVADHRGERIAVPLLERPGRHDVGVAGEAKERRAGPAPRPEVVDVAEPQVLHAKAERRETLAHERLTAVVDGTHRGSRHEVAGEGQGVRHQNLSTGGRRRKLAQRPHTPRAAAAMSTQSGIARPRKRQVILAHSPDPVSTLTSTSVRGNTFSMKSSDAPQAGTLPGGAFWM